MKHRISLTINGKKSTHEVEPRLLLIQFLRDNLNLTGPHCACETSLCGACTVAVDGLAVKSCAMFAVQLDGREVVTIEGISTNGKLHPVQEAFVEFGALQCGYCTSGFILTTKALLDEIPHPSEQQIRDYLAGNFCRCGCYQEIIQAVKNVRSEA